MTALIIALAATVILTIVLFYFGHNNCEWYQPIAMITAALGVVAAIIMIGFLVFYSVNWTASRYKADILNREYHTSYSQAEIFYASDVIDTIDQLQRQRIEVSGNLNLGNK